MKKILFTPALLCLLLTSCEKDTVNSTEDSSIDTKNVILEEPDVALPVIGKTTDGLAARIGGWNEVFADGFNPGSNYFDKWIVGAEDRAPNDRKDYNSNFTTYDRDNVSLDRLDGLDCLRLTAWNTGSGFQSGHVKSKTSFHPNNNEDIWMGARIKLIAYDGNTPRGFNQTYGVWPAFWTTNESVWPTKGEIDMMEGYSYGGSSNFSRNLFYGNDVGLSLIHI